MKPIIFLKKRLFPFCNILLLLLSHFTVHAQEPPPRPIAIYAQPDQGLIFGAVFLGVTGGSVTVYANGSRSVTGDITQANMGVPFSPAIFEVDANRGTLVSILNGPDALLTGSNGGSISLHLGASDKSSPFITTATSPGFTEVRIGGTLTIGNALANPAGAYSGTFSVTFIQE